MRLGSVGGHRRIGLEELLQSEIDWFAACQREEEEQRLD